MLTMIRKNVIDLPVKFSLSYFWCGGFMIRCFMVVQVFSGLIISFLYTADPIKRFGILDRTNESLFVWLVRYTHIWGATFLFILFFIHMGRSLYYSSYKKIGVWKVGFILYIVLMIETFLGYILPWHQMSYWAATVLTSVLNSIPFIGTNLYKFVVGGFSVTEDTLVRVFSAHVRLAFIIIGLSVIHLFYLHKGGSNNPLNIKKSYTDIVLFHRFFTFKDGYVLCGLMRVFLMMIWMVPDYVLDVEGYIPANPLVTPESIKPEWYFLAFYAMLRSVESKIGGLVLVVCFLFVLWWPTINQSACYSLSRQLLFWISVVLFVLLRYLGACHPEAPYVIVRKVMSLMIVVLIGIYKGLWAIRYIDEVQVEEEI